MTNLMKVNKSSILSIITIGFISCNNPLEKKIEGQIVLGDSSTIVTETDPKYLTNNFDDISLKSTTSQSDLPVTDEVISSDSTKTLIPEQNSNNSTQNGYKLQLKNNTLILVGLSESDIRKSSDNSYVTNLKKLPNQISVSGEGYIKSRYVASAYFVKNKTKVKLSDLGEYRSDWVQNNSKNNSIQLVKIPSNISFKKVSAKEIQRAINNSVGKLKISQKEKNQLVADVNKIQSTDHAQIEIIVEKIEWDILINNKSDKMYFTF